MKTANSVHILRKPVFLYLLPVFFILHGIAQYFISLSLKESVTLLVKYFGSCLLLSFLFWLIYKNFYKANLISFFLMTFYFFFGSAHDFLKKFFDQTIIVKYSFILPITFIGLTLLVIYLKKTKHSFTRTTMYLNWLFLLLIVVDVGTIILKHTKKPNVSVTNLSKNTVVCDTCKGPDIYLIVADEYAGSSALKDIFSFNNSDFENELQKRNFYTVNHPKANYNPTYYSMASMLNMDYIKNLDDTVNYRDLFACIDLIRKNNVLRFLKKAGFSIYNYSFFSFGNTEPIRNSFSKSAAKVITAQTFINRLIRDVGYYFASDKRRKEFTRRDLYYNQKVDSLTREITVKKTPFKKFVYTHFEMPHWPYYFDRNGKETNSDTYSESHKINKDAYIEYLIYTNKKLLELIDYIKVASANAAIIILVSDHGFRQLPDSVDKKYHFLNFCSVYIPGEDYSGFYPGMSNINLFRIILNTQFGQKFSMLKDSVIFLNSIK